MGGNNSKSAYLQVNIWQIWIESLARHQVGNKVFVDLFNSPNSPLFPLPTLYGNFSVLNKSFKKGKI